MRRIEHEFTLPDVIVQTWNDASRCWETYDGPMRPDLARAIVRELGADGTKARIAPAPREAD